MSVASVSGLHLHPSPSAREAEIADLRFIRDRLGTFLSGVTVAGDELDRHDRLLAGIERAALDSHLDRLEKVSRIEASLPLARSAEIHAERFGARGDGVADDGPALRAALEAAREAGPGATLVLRAGTYRLSSLETLAARTHWLIENVRDVLVEARGGLAVLLCSQIASAFTVRDCHRLTMRGIAVDWDPHPIAEGNVVDVDAEQRHLVWQAQPGCPDLLSGAHALSPRLAGRLMEERSGRHVRRSIPLHRVQRAGVPGRYLLFPTAAAWDAFAEIETYLNDGYRLSLGSRNARGDHPSAVWVRNSTFVTLEDVHVWAAHHFGFLCTDSTGIVLRRCAVEPRPGSGRLACVNADAYHFRSNRIGPRLEACRARAAFDDCSNFYTRCASVIDQPGPRKLIVDADWDPDAPVGSQPGTVFADSGGGAPALRESAEFWRPSQASFVAGDWICPIDPADGGILPPVKIVETEPCRLLGDHRVLMLTLAEDLPPLRSRRALGKDLRCLSDCEFLNRFDPGDPIEHFVANVCAKSDGLVVRNCAFENGLVAGMKLKASNAIVAGNVFVHLGLCGIDICHRMIWQEGYAPRRVSIAGNRFATERAIRASCDYPGGLRRFGPPHIGGLEISENVFDGTSGFAIELHCVRDVKAEANRFVGGDWPVNLNGKERHNDGGISEYGQPLQKADAGGS